MFHSGACNARALRNEIMVLEVLEAKVPAIFRQELFTTLVHYYEEILGLHGAGGRPKPKSFKRKMKSVMVLPAPAETAGSVSAEKPLNSSQRTMVVEPNSRLHRLFAAVAARLSPARTRE